MELPNQQIRALEIIIDRVFNPSKKRSSLLRLTRKMPYIKDFPKNDIDELEKQGHVVTLPTAFGDRVTITPEGIIFLESYKKYGSQLEKLKKVAYQSYKEHCFHKIKRLRKKEKLKTKHISILLFFLLNSSIGENKPYKISSYEDKSHLERIVRSYIYDKQFEVEDNYALSYYLVEAKRILGDIAFNKKPIYYLRKETLDYVLDSISMAVKNDSSFPERWRRLKKAYRESITFLRTRGNSYYTTSWEMELDKKFVKQ